MASTKNTIRETPKKRLLSGKKIWVLAGICIVTFFCFRYSLNNLFTNWDDDVYVTNDQYIKAFTAENLKTIFTEDITKNNYHPFTMLSLALNYHFTQLEPNTYYLTNILIHLANVILVFFLAAGLFQKLKTEDGKWKTKSPFQNSTFNSQLFVAAFCALWFGVHPMHVESVSWIAERKDVLYAFFYFAGLLFYLRYVDDNKIKWYLFTLVFFIASCLSKPMAVVFPVSLLAIDLLVNRKWEAKVLVEKIPLLIASLVCGGYAYYRQNATGAIAPFGALTLAERTMYASYGFVMYVTKLFNPTFLSTFYPYPYRYIDGTLPWIYYASPIIAALIITVPLIVAWRMNKGYFRVIAFGLGFFIVNIIFVLQFISCGAAIMADRYSYVSYFGLFFMIVFFLNEIIVRFPLYKISFVILLLFLSGGLSYLCYQRTKVWHNSETLLKDAIQKYPFRALLSYKWLGNYYLDSLKLDNAEACYRMLTLLRSADSKVYDNLGNVLKYKNEYREALGAYDTSIEKGGNIYRTLLDRSSCLSDLGDTNAAIQDYVTAVKINPDAEKNYSEAGFTEVQGKQYANAIGRYNILLKFSPNNPYYYFYRGVSEFGEDKMKESATDFKTALLFNNREVSVVAAYNLSVACDSLNDDSGAVHYALVAQQYGYNLDPDYINKLKSKKHSN
jgi:tetratricopeptide (TPR) repeat protein